MYYRLTLYSDDTSVAILEKHDTKSPSSSLSPFPALATLHCHQKITSNNTPYGGIHPLISLDSHQENLATLVASSLQYLPDAHLHPDSSPASTIPIRLPNGTTTQKLKPTFITATRGPGMRSSLSTGLDTAKGLAAAWQIPFLGVNHMQAHALTPRLVSALSSPTTTAPTPRYPFLTLLVSGGHTLLAHSISATNHPILASTTDIAIGDCLDKIARLVLPSEPVPDMPTMYGPLLERFAFPQDEIGSSDYDYKAPSTRHEELIQHPTAWGWALGVPLAETRAMEYSFSGMGSSCWRIMRYGLGGVRDEERKEVSIEERRILAREAMRVGFEHLASRVVMALQGLRREGIVEGEKAEIGTLVVSGGVAANGFLRKV